MPKEKNDQVNDNISDLGRQHCNRNDRNCSRRLFRQLQSQLDTVSATIRVKPTAANYSQPMTPWARKAPQSSRAMKREGSRPTWRSCRALASSLAREPFATTETRSSEKLSANSNDDSNDGDGSRGGDSSRSDDGSRSSRRDWGSTALVDILQWVDHFEPWQT